MRAVLIALALLAGCRTPERQAGPVTPQPPPPPPASANFTLTLYEVVGSPEEDAPAWAEVYVDGELAGRTPEAPRSQPKSWGAALPEGNRLLRFVVQDSSGPWTSDRQPRERFFRVEPGQRTAVTLKYFDRGRQHELSVERRPL